MPFFQSLASDFSSNFIIFIAQTVGSSTYLMEIKIEFVIDGKERSFLFCPLPSQFVDVANRKV